MGAGATDAAAATKASEEAVAEAEYFPSIESPQTQLTTLHVEQKISFCAHTHTTTHNQINKYLKIYSSTH
jgi:hypothetical protein